MKRIETFTLLCILLFISCLAQARIIHIPGDYSTIQQGINIALPGDTVLVEEGTYYQQLDLTGHAPICVASRYILDGEESHISATILDGSQIPISSHMSVVTFGPGNDSTSVLTGFTIQHGKGTLSPAPDLNGGGIYITSAGAKISHNIIRDNVVSDSLFSNSLGSVGGGISMDYVSTNLPTVIEYNTIRDNEVRSVHNYVIGGGVYTIGAARIDHNTVIKNIAFPEDTASANGAGMCSEGWFPDDMVTYTSNIVDSNTVYAAANKFARGGGIEVVQAKVLIANNVVNNNAGIIEQEPSYLYGIGLRFFLLYDGSVISGNTVIGNTASPLTHDASGPWGGGMQLVTWIQDSSQVEVSGNFFSGNVADVGGAIATEDYHLTMFNNIFRQNYAGYLGGAIQASSETQDLYHHILISNCTFYENSSGNAGAVVSTGANPLVINTIFCHDSAAPGGYHEIDIESGLFEMYYSDLDTLATGQAIEGSLMSDNSMIFQNPMFSDDQTLLTEHWSPCVDVGTAGLTCPHGVDIVAPLTDFNGTSRPVGAGFDMGAYEMEAWGLGTGRITNDELRVTNYPNPVRYSTTFVFQLDQSSSVRLTIFDSFGRIIDEPVREDLGQGLHEVPWNPGSTPAGMYYYRLETSRQIASGKLLVVR